MTEQKFKRTKLSKIMSLEAYRALEAFVRNKYKVFIATGKEHCVPSVADYFKVNGSYQWYSKTLEKIIIKLLRDAGWIVKRIDNSGKYVDKREIVEDVIGRPRIIGSTNYVPDKNVIEGQADIQAFGRGIYWELELKTTDRQSEAQKQHQKQVEQQGGKYSIVRTVDDFLQEYEKVNNR